MALKRHRRMRANPVELLVVNPAPRAAVAQQRHNPAWARSLGRGMYRGTRYAAESAGSLTLDAGAVRAVVKQRRSLLPAGVTAVAGKFFGGDVVQLCGPDGEMVARGVVAYDAAELATMIGRSTSDLPAELRRPAVHADDLVPV